MITRTIIFIVSAHLIPVLSFSPSLHRTAHPAFKASRLSPESWALEAKKNKGKKNKGFGKQTKPASKKSSAGPPDLPSDATENSVQNFSPLESVEGSDYVSKLNIPVDLDPNADPEDRAKEILKQRFGLRSYEEQEGDVKKIEKDIEQKERMAKMKKMAEAENFDIFQVVPTPILSAFDTFLKAGLTICTVLFIFAGFAISIEAWGKATGGVIPDGLDQFIVNVVEPNFTTGGLVLLGFSITLGIFAAAQLGSETSQYQEKP